MPHITYHHQPLCPWPGCEFSITAMDFQVENWPGLYAGLITAWHAAGLVGRCPGCGQHVLFTLTGKQALTSDPVAIGLVVLPDDWYQNAYVEN